jgi:hypothetical protein
MPKSRQAILSWATFGGMARGSNRNAAGSLLYGSLGSRRKGITSASERRLRAAKRRVQAGSQNSDRMPGDRQQQGKPRYADSMNDEGKENPSEKPSSPPKPLPPPDHLEEGKRGVDVRPVYDIPVDGAPEPGGPTPPPDEPNPAPEPSDGSGGDD